MAGTLKWHYTFDLKHQDRQDWLLLQPIWPVLL